MYCVGVGFSGGLKMRGIGLRLIIGGVGEMRMACGLRCKSCLEQEQIELKRGLLYTRIFEPCMKQIVTRI